MADPKLRRFRYGVQVNSLGLTEQQPENNVPRIVLEALGVTLSRDARARALQLPAWNEALGLPRPWDQQWSLRIQQILAFETDLLEYDDIFDGSHGRRGPDRRAGRGGRAELDDILALGGAFEAIDEMKRRLVASQAERVRRIESGELPVVGVNCFTATEPSPLAGGRRGRHILRVDPAVEAELVERRCGVAGPARRRRRAAGPRRAAAGGRDEPDANIMPATIALAHAGGTTGEWAGALREVWGEYRAPTGVGGGGGPPGRDVAAVRARVRAVWPSRTADRPGCSWPSPGSTATATAPSRSPWPPATPDSR